MSFDKLKKHSIENIGNGTSDVKIQLLENSLNIKLPKEYRNFIEKIGYAEIYGDEIYSIYEVPDKIACNGLHWMNIRNEYLQDGYIEFFSNDIDGVFFIKTESGQVFLNGKENLFANTFSEFVDKLLHQ